MSYRPGEILATIRTLLPSLLPTEQAVASVFLTHSDQIVELSSQQVADLAGASRATVVRTCQSLGFSGYQQLRVLLARDAVAAASSAQPATESPDGAMDVLEGTFRHLAANLPGMLALLDAETVEKATAALASAHRVVAIGNGLSLPLATDVAARLTTIGRPADAPLDAMTQQITARLLGPDDVLLAISGSGANELTLRSVEAAISSGATVIAVTAFARSPLARATPLSLVVTMHDPSFRDEIMLTSRLPQAILIEGLVAAVSQRLGPDAARAKALALEAISAHLVE